MVLTFLALVATWYSRFFSSFSSFAVRTPRSHGMASLARSHFPQE